MKKRFLPLVIALTLSASLSNAQGLLDIVKRQGVERLRTEAEKRLNAEIAKYLSPLVGANAPLKLDEASAYPPATVRITNFNPKPLALEDLASLRQPLKLGDWSVPVVAYCTALGAPAPGQGQPYKLGRVEGPKARAISLIAAQGSMRGVSPTTIQGIIWRLEDGISFGKLSKENQDLVRKIAPAAVRDLGEDPIQKMLSAYGNARKVLGNRLPPFETLLSEKFGDAGKLAVRLIAARQILMDRNISDERLPALLFDPSYGLPQVVPGTGNQPSPWAEIRTGVYARLKIVEGVHAHNVLELRVTSHAARRVESADQPSGMMLASYSRPQGPLLLLPNLVELLGYGELLGETGVLAGAMTGAARGGGLLIGYTLATHVMQPTLIALDKLANEVFGNGNDAKRPDQDGVDEARVEEIVRKAGELKQRDDNLGEATEAEADAAGKKWVGPNYETNDKGELESEDGLRRYRPPQFKQGQQKVQANLESRADRTRDWKSWRRQRKGQKDRPGYTNGHLDVRRSVSNRLQAERTRREQQRGGWLAGLGRIRTYSWRNICLTMPRKAAAPAS